MSFLGSEHHLLFAFFVVNNLEIVVQCWQIIETIKFKIINKEEHCNRCLPTIISPSSPSLTPFSLCPSSLPLPPSLFSFLPLLPSSFLLLLSPPSHSIPFLSPSSPSPFFSLYFFLSLPSLFPSHFFFWDTGSLCLLPATSVS